jgi:hypothetical protein
MDSSGKFIRLNFHVLELTLRWNTKYIVGGIVMRISESDPLVLH